MGLQKDLSTETKEEILQFLLINCKEGVPIKGKMKKAATNFNCCRKTASRLWESARNQRTRGEIIKVVSKRIGRPRQPKHEVNLDKIKQEHYKKRGTIRALASSINVPKTIVGRWAKEKLIRAHTNAIEPDLTTPNKLLRMNFSLKAIEFDSALNILKFKPMENVIHIDEKWFYLTKNNHRYYMTHNETDPHKTNKSKKFLPKVMFMCVVCRPIFLVKGSVIFYGKIGIWPFTQEVEAKRNSKKRPAGTMEIKPIESITKQVINDCLIKQILPAIKAKWPSCLSKTIYIQQDNARPHIIDSDSDFRASANVDGFQISLVQQPPNSPDVNVNDLGFFRAIQSLQQQHACRDANELINAVLTSFNTLEPMKLNKIFFSLQSCLHEILRVKGCNNYKLPHMGKDALILHNQLPRNLEIPMELVRDSIDYLIGARHTNGIEGLIQDLGMHMET